MADVSVLKVPVDDSQVQQFLEAFNKFRVDAAEVPKTMADIDRVVEKLPEHLRPGADALAETSGGVADVLDGAEDAGGAPRGGKKRRRKKKSGAAAALDWSLTNLGARRFAGSISGATRDLARWERLTGVFSGLLGAGGLYGLNTLAAASAQRRQQSAGYGLSTGELAAFNTNYGRLGDVGGVLAGIGAAQTDVTKRQPLQSLGVDPRGKNALSIFGEMLPKLKDLADRADPKAFSASLKPYNLDQLGVTEDMMRVIRGMRRSEIDDMRAGAARDAGPMGVPDDVGRKWQELVTTFHKAETQIQTALADDLVAITPSLTHLSESATHLVDVLLGRKELKDWLERTNTAMLRFADDVGSDEARKKFQAFLHQFDVAKKDFDALERWFDQHGTTLLRLGQAILGARVGSILGPAGAAAGAVIGATGMMPTHLSGQRGYRAEDHGDQYRGGGAAERPTLEQRNLSRKGLGLPEYKDQKEYDEKEPPVATRSSSVEPARPAPTSTDGVVGGSNLMSGGVVGGSNLMSGGHYPGARPGADLTTITTADGKRLTVHRDAAPSFAGFLKELESGGYKVDSLGGYADRDNRSAPGRKSEHAYGNAIDINPSRNPFRSDQTDLPPNVSEMARKYGLSWGGDWRHKDTMHFEWRGTRPWLKDHEDAPKVGETPTKEDLNRANNDAYKSPANPFMRRAAGAQAKTDNSMPKDAYGAHRRAVTSLLHPNARRKPPQSVVVTDNSGGSSVVTVAH